MQRYVTMMFFPVLALSLILLGCPPTTVTVPDLTGLTQVNAMAALLLAQLGVGTVTNASSQTIPAGCVISQNPVAGSKVQSGTKVDMVISTGPAPSLAWSYVPSVNTIKGLTISETNDTGYIVGGTYNGNYNMYALKLTDAGAKDWDKTYTNLRPGSSEELWRHEARGLLQTVDGGYIMLGSGNNDQDGLPNPAYLLVKTVASGEVDWSKTYAPLNPYSEGHVCTGNKPGALNITSDGGYVVFGSSYVGQYDLASILKTDAEGTVEFCKVINDNAREYNQIIKAGQQTADGGYILCGYSDNGGAHGYMALLIKLDSDGELLFSKTYQDTADGYGAEAFAVTQTADGGYVLGGDLVNSITPKAINHGCWMAKVDAEGEIVWFNAYGSTATIQCPYTIKETPQGDILAGGRNNVGAMTLGKFTSAGVLLWNFVLPEEVPHVTARDMVLLDDGAIVAVGSGNSSNTAVCKVDHMFAAE